MKFEKLFAPINIGRLTIPNRIVLPAMNTSFGCGGEVTDRLIAYHVARARGGCGLNIVELCDVEEGSAGTFNNIRIDSDAYVPGLKMLCDAVHKVEGHVALQLLHRGRVSNPKQAGKPRRIVSYIPGMIPNEDSRVMTVEEIRHVIKSYGKAAQRARLAGFDAVELHGAHGYLIGQFISPFTNRREDEYGGSFENRMRFALEVLSEVKGQAGADFPVLFRINSEEFVPEGMHYADMQDVARVLVEHGCDALHVSAAVVETNQHSIPPGFLPEAWNVEAAGNIRKAIDAKVPVIAVGRIARPELAEKILQEEKADLIAVGRGQIADPSWAIKSREGKNYIPCICCNEGCANHVAHHEPIACAMNPRTGRERLFPYTKSARVLRVVVVGGGPAGMQAALTAAERGHNVILLEKKASLGGLVHAAVLPLHKEAFSRLLVYFEKALSMKGVDVRLGVEADPVLIRQLAPEVLLVATGSRPVIPRFCAGAPHLVTAEDVLFDLEKAGHNVLVLGGGLVGSELAEKLAEAGRSVTIIELRDRIAADMENRERRFLLPRLNELGVKLMVNTEVVGFSENGSVQIRNEYGVERSLEGFDTVVIALGYRPERSLMKELDAQGIPFMAVGDNVKPGKVFDAVKQGFEKAYSL